MDLVTMTIGLLFFVGFAFFGKEPGVCSSWAAQLEQHAIIVFFGRSFRGLGHTRFLLKADFLSVLFYGSLSITVRKNMFCCDAFNSLSLVHPMSCHPHGMG